jgi:Fe-S cluster biogenesis protein NfuA
VLDDTQVRAALIEVATLVQADGGDIELVSMDPERGEVALRLVVEGANCAECVLPRPMLEGMATSIMQRSAPAIRAVSIDDPREHPGYIAPEH